MCHQIQIYLHQYVSSCRATVHLRPASQTVLFVRSFTTTRVSYGSLHEGCKSSSATRGRALFNPCNRRATGLDSRAQILKQRTMSMSVVTTRLHDSIKSRRSILEPCFNPMLLLTQRNARRQFGPRRQLQRTHLLLSFNVPSVCSGNQVAPAGASDMRMDAELFVCSSHSDKNKSPRQIQTSVCVHSIRRVSSLILWHPYSSSSYLHLPESCSYLPLPTISREMVT